MPEYKASKTSDLVMALLLDLGASVKRSTLEKISDGLTQGEKMEVMSVTAPNIEVIIKKGVVILKKKKGKSEVKPELFGYEYLFKLDNTIVLKQKSE